MRRRLGALLGSLGAVFLVFFSLVRPWYLGWGATADEARRSLPGDEIIPDAASQETRAITINAPVDAVWPWLAQLGQDRGGFYSFDLLENLVGCEMPTVDVLRPAAQAWKLGDKLWMYPPSKAGGAGFATLRTYVPGRALGFATHAVGTALTAPADGSWSFALEPTASGATRLLIRGRGAPGRSFLGKAFDRTIFEPIHFVMERRMMLGIKQIVEGGSRTWFQNHLQVVLWVLTFGLIIASACLVIWASRPTPSLVAFVAGCVVFQILTLAQPPVVLGALLVAGVSMAVLWPGSRRRAIA